MKGKYNCYHCGDFCIDDIVSDGNHFCCNGCKHVYLLLSENGLCNYYQLDNTPGIKVKGKFKGDRFAYLDDESVISKLILFNSSHQINVTQHASGAQRRRLHAARRAACSRRNQL